MWLIQMLKEHFDVVKAKFCRQDLITEGIEIIQCLRIVHGRKRSLQLVRSSASKSGVNVETALEPEEVQRFDQVGSQFFAVHDRIQHSVFQQEFTFLKTSRKFLAYGLFDDPRACKAD